ncbi:MAG TPA: branched-chain amino acid ABC transporter substrate-binding protein [Ktedonobacterales bacterium]|nr:branched-chain amino acid ABC transporter substrate-binding protein [Ktedonobacterales bacterium]
MQHRRLLHVFPALVAIGALVAFGLAGCGGGGQTTNKALKIGTDFPVSGTDAAATLPAEYGVNMAVEQNKDLGSGYTLSVVNKNDEGQSGADPTIGASNINQLIADSSVMAAVGPFNSSVAVAEIPIANRNGFVLISPTNTNPGLTIRQYAAASGIQFDQLHPAGKPESYFRVCANDVAQGKVDAQLAFNPAPQGVGAKTAFVVDDNTTYGKGLADFFTQSFTQLGGTVVTNGRASISPQQVSTFPQLATTIKNANPDVVFYGGVTSQGGGALKKDLVAIGYTKPMVGGDGIASDPAWITTAGAAAAQNTYGTVAAPDPSALTSAAATKFKSDYTAYVQGKPNNDLLPYSAQAYDAAMIEITAIKNLIKDNKPVTRAAVRDQVASIQYDGVTGHISFDENGDNKSSLFSVYVVDQTSKWVFQQEVNA